MTDETNTPAPGESAPPEEPVAHPIPVLPNPGTERRKANVARTVMILVIIAALLLVCGAGFAVYKAFQRRQVGVPDLRLETETEARNTLADAGLSVGEIGQVATDGVGPGRVATQTPAYPSTVDAKSAIDFSLAVAPSVGTIPKVDGLSQTEAVNRLQASLFVPLVLPAYHNTVPKDTIIEQAPKAESHAMTGSNVVIFTSIGPGNEGVVVPNLVGLMKPDAQATLKEDGLTPVWLDNNESIKPVGQVIQQVPSPGTHVPEGSPVGVVVVIGHI